MTAGDRGQDSSLSDGGEGTIKHSTPKSTRLCHPTDDTIPVSEAEDRTPTGDTIESSAFMDLNKEEREEFTGWDGLQEALEESKREGIGKLQEEVEPFSILSYLRPSQIDNYLVSGGGNHPRLKELL